MRGGAPLLRRPLRTSGSRGHGLFRGSAEGPHQPGYAAAQGTREKRGAFMNLEDQFRTMLRERAEGVAAAPIVPERTVRRARMNKAFTVGGTLAVAAAVAVAGAFFVDSAISSDAAPVQPANTPSPEETDGSTSSNEPRDV